MNARYQPGDFPPKNLDWERLAYLTGPANLALAHHGAYLRAQSNQASLISVLLANEAVESCRIEGARASLSDVFEHEAGGNSGASIGEIEEIQNCRSALWNAIGMGVELPLLSERVLKLTHKELMKGSRGSRKTPGSYRRIQNWIGTPGSTIETAKYVPCPIEVLDERMSVWERYMNSDDCADKLVLLALAHAEFEAIHPFLDGNGRLGRLLVPLFLVDKGLLDSPAFFMSEFLFAHRPEYYENLLAVSRDGDWTGWCEFFLAGTESQAKSSHAKVKAMCDLYNSCKEWIADSRLSVKAISALDFFFKQPVFSRVQLEQEIEVSKPTVARLIDKFVEADFLQVWHPGKGRRSPILAFPKLLETLTDQQEPAHAEQKRNYVTT